MKWSQMLMILLLILAQISFVFAGTSHEIQFLPETPYLFREINAPIKKDEIKSLQLLSHSHVDSLAAEVKKSKAKFEHKFFYRIDVVNFQIQDVGQVILKESQLIPPDKIRTIPAGKYFVINFEGPGSEIDETFRRIPEILKAAGATPESPVITYYKQSALNSPSENIKILIKLEESFFRNGCSVFTEEGIFKERFPGNQCHFFADGSFVSISDDFIRMFSPRNEIMWEIKGNFHHQLNVSHDQKRILAMTDYVREENGEKIREEAVMIISREGKVLADKKLNELLKLDKKWKVAPFRNQGESKVEVSHLNSIYEIPSNSSPLPYLKEGNIIINSLHLGAIILDPGLKQNLKIIKLPVSVAHMVHDVQVTPEGKILYFNNSLKAYPNYSGPEVFDPATQITTSLVSDSVKRIISHTCGSVQILNQDVLMYAGNFSGPIFIDRKSGNRIKHPSEILMRPLKGHPTFMIKFIPLSSFFLHRQ